MITDAQLTLADNQAVTVTAASANQIDLTTARNLARSGARNMRFVALVTTTFTGATSMQATVRQSAAANMGSPDVIATGPVVVEANLTAGKKLLDIPWPDVDPVAAKQYIDMNFVVVGTHGAGAIWAGIVLDDEGGEYRLGVTGR